MSDSIKPIPPPCTDTLLFTSAKDGKFSVKRAYLMLKGDNGSHEDKKFWMGIWKTKGLSPKLKLFLWRCVKNAIPVRGVIGARIPSIPFTCQLCNSGPETVQHMLFGCDFVRAIWCTSPLNLRSNHLQGDCREILTEMATLLNESDFVKFVCMAWAIWRSRNDAVLGGKRQEIPSCLRYYKDTLLVCQTGFKSDTGTQPSNQSDVGNTTMQAGVIDPICYVDGSWSPNGTAGISAYITVDGKVVQWTSKKVNSMSPAQAEACAILQGLWMMHQQNYPTGQLLSDSKEIVDSISHKQLVIHDWRSFKEVWEAWQLLNQRGGSYRTTYCSREDPAIQIAHHLANLGMIKGWDRNS